MRCASCRSPYWNKPRRRRSTAASRIGRYVQVQSAVQRAIEQDASPKERLQSFWVMQRQQARWDAVVGMDALRRWREEKARDTLGA